MSRDVFMCNVTSRSVIIQNYCFPVVSCAICTLLSLSKLVAYRCQHFSVLCLGKQVLCILSKSESKFSYF